MKKIYLACPYSDPDPEVCEQRTIEADKAAAKLMEQGNIVFSPLSHSHRIAHHINNHLDHDFWLKQDLHFLIYADEMIVLKLPGWMESRGIHVEMLEADSLKIPISYMEPL